MTPMPLGAPHTARGTSTLAASVTDQQIPLRTGTSNLPSSSFPIITSFPFLYISTALRSSLLLVSAREEEADAVVTGE